MHIACIFGELIRLILAVIPYQGKRFTLNGNLKVHGASSIELYLGEHELGRRQANGEQKISATSQQKQTEGSK